MARTIQINPEESISEIRDFLEREGVYDLTEEEILAIKEMGMYIETETKPKQAKKVETNKDASLVDSLLSLNVEDIKVSEIKSKTKSSTEKETISKTTIVGEVDLGIDFGQVAEQTIGEFMTQYFLKGWRIKRAVFKRGYSAEESKLVINMNGKASTKIATIAGSTISLLRIMAEEVAPTITGVDGRTITRVLWKDITPEEKMIKITTPTDKGDLDIIYVLTTVESIKQKLKDLMAKELSY